MRLSALMTLLLLLPACSVWVGDEEWLQWEKGLKDTEAECEQGAVADHQGIAMAQVCPGTFTMGSPKGEEGRDADETQHEVTLTRAYWMGVYEVTQAEFEAIMGYQTACFAGCDECPVECLEWHEAAAFANAVSSSAGLDECYTCDGEGASLTCTSSGSPYRCEGYRLPTEAEWENAARAGTSSAFSNGGDLEPGDADNCEGNLALTEGWLDDIAVYCGDKTGQPTEVGRKDPNAWGLYDMHGNVWEWCNDWWLADYAADIGTDPWGDSTGSRRVTRGGSWYNLPQDLRSATRYRNDTNGDHDLLGFRLARTD